MASVVVVDDEPDIREVIRFALEEAGFRVLEAGHRLRFERASRVRHFHEERLGAYLRTQRGQGYWRAFLNLGIIEAELVSTATLQVLVDLVIACTLAIVWMVADASADLSVAKSDSPDPVLVDPVSPELLTPNFPPLGRNPDGSCPLCSPDPGVPILQLRLVPPK